MSVTTMEINPPVGSPRMRFFMLIHDCTEGEQGGRQVVGWKQSKVQGGSSSPVSGWVYGQGR